MVRLLLPLLICLTIVLVAAFPTHASVTPVAGTGILDYRIIKDGVPPTCEGQGPFVATFDSATSRFSVSGSAVGCLPIFSIISDCILDEDGTVRCDKVVGDETILITWAPDGTFDYVWDAPDFHEEIDGLVERVDWV